MPRLKASNRAQTELATSIDNATTTVNVLDISVFPDAPFRLSVNNEIMEVTAKGTSLTVLRAQEGTAATNHAAGDRVEMRFTAGMYDELADKAYFESHKAEKASQGEVHGFRVNEDKTLEFFNGEEWVGVQSGIGSIVTYVAGWEEGEFGVFPKGIDVPYATDDDFSGTTDGNFQYIGTATTVKIPPVIKGVPVTSYASMFNTDNGKLVEKVISFNPNVTTMSYMFYNSKATTLDLSSFDTSKVTDMSYMFSGSQATTLDLSSFDTSKVTDMYTYDMFSGSQATTGYARTQADADKFNASSGKPAGLTFLA